MSLILASTSDKIRVTTSSTATTDVHASWVDVNGTTITPGRTNTAISTATTTDLVASPGASTYRTVKTLSIRNRHASTSQDVTVIHTDGTNAMELVKATLTAGDALHYDEHNGFTVRDSLGRIKRREDSLVTAASPSFTTVVLGSDVTNNNASANTIADVTGLSVSVTSGLTYWFRACVMYTAAATTTGSRWSINGPAITSLYYRSEYSLTTTTRTTNEGLSTYDVPAASNATSAATTSNVAIVEGVLTPSASGTLIVRFASEVSSSAIVAKAGSILMWQQVL
jgi:hypothetical protein